MGASVLVLSDWACELAGAEAGPASVATGAEEIQRCGSEGDGAAI